jgi:hypothetical protein
MFACLKKGLATNNQIVAGAKKRENNGDKEVECE